MSSSQQAKDEERRSLDAEIQYFQSTIQSHQHEIQHLQNLAKIPFFKARAMQQIQEEQTGINVSISAIKRYQDLEKYYTSIGRL